MARYLLLAALLALASFAAQAQSYRCVAKDGKKYYGQSVPPQCIGAVVEQISAQGAVLRRIDPQASSDDRAKHEAEEAERKKQAALAKDQGRRDQALLATYASEKDVEDMRKRALENDQRLLNDLEKRVASLRQQQASGKGDPKVTEIELKSNENLLAGKKKEVAAINAKYDDDKKRYLELTGRK
jgi:chromosome segregation ATPase